MSTTGLRTGTRMSLDEFLALGETDGKWELDDGVLYIMASGTPDHQFLGLEFSRRILDYLDSFDEPPAHLYQEMTTILSRELQRAPEPDIVVILSEKRDIIGRTHVEASPDIVAEILSTDRNRDLVRKRQIYTEAGVPEYWLIDPENDSVMQLELRDGEYFQRVILGTDDTLTTPLLPDLSIPLAEVFRHRRRPPRGE